MVSARMKPRARSLWIAPAARRGRADHDWERSFVETTLTTHSQGIWPARPGWLRHQRRFPADLLGPQDQGARAVDRADDGEPELDLIERLTPPDQSKTADDARLVQFLRAVLEHVDEARLVERRVGGELQADPYGGRLDVARSIAGRASA